MKTAAPKRSTRQRASAVPAGLDQDLQELRAESARIREKGAEPVTDTFAQWLLAHYVSAARQAAKETNGAGLPIPFLRELSTDIAKLRRGDHSAERLLLEREWVAVEREKRKEWMEEQFEIWMERPDIHERFNPSQAVREEKERQIRAILKIGPEYDLPPAPRREQKNETTEAMDSAWNSPNIDL